MALRSPRPDLRRRLQHIAASRVPTRAYMSLTLASVMLLSVVLSAGLLRLGLTDLLVRYALVALCAYGLFIVLCRLTLSRLVEEAVPGHEDRLLPSLTDLADGASLDLGGGWGGGGSSSSGGGSPSAPELPRGDFGGGASGGGGAGSRWEGPDLGGGSGKSGGSSLDGGADLDGEGAVALLLIAVVLALFGASIYVVYQAPIILTEAAFEVLLAAGLARAARRQGWATALVRSTLLPFGVVFVLILAFGWAAGRFCPEADRLSLVVDCVQDE